MRATNNTQEQRCLAIRLSARPAGQAPGSYTGHRQAPIAAELVVARAIGVTALAARCLGASGVTTFAVGGLAVAGFGFFHALNNTRVGYQGQVLYVRVWKLGSPLPVRLGAGCRRASSNRNGSITRWQSGADESRDGSGGFGQLHLGLLAALGERVAHAVVKVLVEQV